MAQLPSSPETTPPNTPKTPNSPIIISDSPTPSPKQTAPKQTTEDPSRTFIDLTILDRLADLKNKIAIPKPKQPDVGSGIMNFETGLQQWIASLKQVCPGMIDPAASDQLWSQFRIWVRAEALKLQDINYEQAQQNFSKLLNEVGSQLLKEDVLLLDSEPWSEKRPASKVQPEEDQTIQAEDVAESSQKLPASDVSQAALDRQTLEELKLNDIRLQQRMDENDQKMKERMDVQDSKIDTVVSMVHKQNETADQIKAMLETLFTRFPPQP